MDQLVGSLERQALPLGNLQALLQVALELPGGGDLPEQGAELLHTPQLQDAQPGPHPGVLAGGRPPHVAQHHRCRKFFTFWERGKTLRKFLQEVRLFGVSRSKKRLIIAENILNMEKFD